MVYAYIINYLPFWIVVKTHDFLVKKDGGVLGIADENLIQSAVKSPAQSYYETICEKAGIMMFLLVKNHGFADGNKRTGVFATEMFLNINGYMLDILSEETADFLTTALERRELTKELITEWLKAHIIKRPDFNSMVKRGVIHLDKVGLIMGLKVPLMSLSDGTRWRIFLTEKWEPLTEELHVTFYGKT